MLTWAKRYSTVFGLGFVIFALAIGDGAIEGDILSANSRPTTFRYFGGTLMLLGLTLWIAKNRIDGERPGLNPVFGLLLSASFILSAISVVVQLASSEAYLLGLQMGLAVAAAALAVGVLSMIFATPGNETYDYPWYAPGFDTSRDAYSSGHIVPTAGYIASDLKRIVGIDEKIEQVLYDAGIKYYNRLADTSPYELSVALAGGDLQDVDTSTWAAQARLADNEDWEALEKLQTRLEMDNTRDSQPNSAQAA